MNSSYYVGRDMYGRPIMVPTGAMSPTLAGGIVGVTLPQGTNPNSTTQSSVNQTANALLQLSTLHNTLLVNGQLTSTGTGDAASAVLPASTIKKPWLDAQDGAISFDQETSVVLPGVGGSTTVVTLAVPQGYDGVINAYSWNYTGAGFVQGSGDLQAQILRNGTPVRNYDNILTEKGSIAIPRPIAPLRIYSLDVITLVINHIANGLLAGNIVGSFVGWFYPSAS
jgi:hypothetical protein